MTFRLLHRPLFAVTCGLLWILLFQAGRAAFMIYNHSLSPQTPLSSLLYSMLAGLRMDASMAAYLILPVCLLLAVACFIPAAGNRKIFLTYSAIMLFPVMMLIVCDLPAYEAWGYRLDITPLRYLATPGEAWASVSHLPVSLFFLSFLAAYALFFFLFKRLSVRLPGVPAVRRPAEAGLMLLLTASLIIPIRGGFQLAPLNQSSVYFGNDAFANQAALNVPWNFMRSLTFLSEHRKNPYEYMDREKAASLKKDLFAASGRPIRLVDSRIKNPNILLILWESFTSKALGLQEGGIPVMPGMEKLMKQGVYFSNVYASGDRTDKGIVSVLSGYPAQPATSIVKEPQKAGKLRALPSLLAGFGYDTRFFYGGETEFANMKAYLLGSGFKSITDVNSFSEKDKNSKWGAHDNVVKDSIINTLSRARRPFFFNWLTLSSHEPFETPVSVVIPGEDDRSKFLNSLHFSDSVIFRLISRGQEQPWWDSTLVIIIADHGHRLPRSISRKEDFHIPMIWTGGAIQNKGITISTVMSQTDLAATLCNQLGIANQYFPWSRDILREGQPAWAYFCFNNGFGLVEPEGHFIFDNAGRRLIEKSGRTDSLMIQQGQALQQLTFADYLAK